MMFNALNNPSSKGPGSRKDSKTPSFVGSPREAAKENNAPVATQPAETK